MSDPTRFDSLKTLGKYALMEKLGDDSLGTVFKSFDRDRDRPVDIRIFCDGIKWNEDLVKLLQKAFRATDRLQHPNLASVIELDTGGAYPYMVLEPLGKRNLRYLASRTTKMSFESKISIMMQLTQGLAFAHMHEIVHKDLCPENIYLKADGCIKIRDFAISHVFRKHLPHPGVRWGAPIYLSPEQIQNKECNEQSDIFAFGIVAYELLTGSHPFYDVDSNKHLDNILQDRPLPTFERHPHFHPRIWHILKKCLAKKPENRYGNADEILDACRDLLKEMSEDVQLMLAELQVAYSSLKAVSEGPNATEKSKELCRNVWNILRGSNDHDFVQLDRLVTDLCEVYPLIQASAHTRDADNAVLEPRMRPEDLYMFSQGSYPLEDKGRVPYPQFRTLESKDKEIVNPLKKAEDSPDTSSSKSASESQEEDLGAEPPPEIVSTDESGDKQDSQDGAGRRSEPIDPTPDRPPVEAAGKRRTKKPDSDCPAEVSMPVRGDSGQGSVKSDSPSRRKGRVSSRKNGRVPRRRYRIVAALLLILLASGFIHIFQKSSGGEAAILNWKDSILNSWMTVKASVLSASPSDIEADSSVGGANILGGEADPQFESVLMDGLEEAYPVDSSTVTKQQRLDRIRRLIDDGELDRAEEELNRLRRVFPNASETGQLYEQLQQKRYRSDDTRRRGNAQTLDVREKEESWSRQFRAAFSRGEYGEAENIANLWMRNMPESSRAEASSETLKKLQTKITSSNLAIAEHRYRDALDELDVAERINPADPNITAMRKTVNSRLLKAQSVLSVLRLGQSATLLLDGNPVGNDGEVRNIKIPKGTHTVRVEKDGYLIASRSQEFLEGQTVLFVYDLAGREIRHMTESDRELLSNRDAMEAVHSFPAEHTHGFLRGGCHGTLLVSHSEVAYRPSSGDHGFEVPFKILNLERDGTVIVLSLEKDNEMFQKLKLESEPVAVELTQIWTALKSLPQK